jgi:hypothetical protein
MAPRTRTSATPGSAAQGASPRRRPASMRGDLARQSRDSSRSMLALAMAQASGLPMKVGPCMKAPGSAAGDGRGDLGGGQRRGAGQIAAGQRLADVMMSGAMSACSQANSRPVRPKPVAISSSDQQQPVAVAEIAHARQVVGGVEAHAAGALDDGFQDHRRQLVAWSHQPASSAMSASVQGRRSAAPAPAAKTCRGSTRSNRLCMPVTGSQTDMASKVSPW